jgi:hypothetical protein
MVLIIPVVSVCIDDRFIFALVLVGIDIFCRMSLINEAYDRFHCARYMYGFMKTSTSACLNSVKQIALSIPCVFYYPAFWV